MSKQKLRTVWCRTMHDDVAFSGGQEYWCRKCLCRFSVPWLSAQNGSVKESSRAVVVLVSRGPVLVRKAVPKTLAA
jgi:hypothetical protein